MEGGTLGHNKVDSHMPIHNADQGVSPRSCDKGPVDLGARGVSCVDDAAGAVAALESEVEGREEPVGDVGNARKGAIRGVRRVKSRAKGGELENPRGALATHGLDGREVAEPVARGERVSGVSLPRVGRIKDSRDAPLGKGSAARSGAQATLGHNDDIETAGGGAQSRGEARDAGAEDGKVGPQNRLGVRGGRNGDGS